MALAAALLLGACSPAPSFHSPRTAEPATLGELVYRIIRDRLETSQTCPAEYVDALASHHERFVTTFDYVLSHELTSGLPDVLGGTIQPFVESGDLPALTDALAEALALLVSDEVARSIPMAASCTSTTTPSASRPPGRCSSSGSSSRRTYITT